MLTQEYINQFLKRDPYKHECYDKANKIHEVLEIHSKGEKPTELLRKARPNEEPKYQTWREERWTPVTKTYFQKAITTLSKIRKAEDWNYGFKEEKNAYIKKESFRDYLTKKYPFFDSFDNWLFQVAWPTMFDDPNAVICCLPLPKKDPKNDTEYLRPFNRLRGSEYVLDFMDGEYATVISDEKSIVTVGDNQVKEGTVYWFFDRETIQIYKQIGSKEKFLFTNLDEFGNPMVIVHNFGHMPCWKIGGTLLEFEDGFMLYDSLISGCVDFFNEAIMDYSDHQVNKAIHLHPDRWEIADVECRGCKGTGQQWITPQNAPKYQSTCGVCQGQGKVAVRSPFAVKYIKAGQKEGVNETIQTPTPPMGYALRDINSMKMLKDEYLDDIRQGLSGINMEFLIESLIEESGVSKSYDHDGLHTLMTQVARNAVENIVIPTCYFTAMYMYSKQVSPKEIEEFLPSIPVPEKFDMVISSLLSEKAVSAKTAGLDESITSNLEISYAKKQFGESSDIPKKMEVIARHDPLKGQSSEEKMTTLSNGGCAKDDYILSNQIYHFTERACVENPDFLTLDYAKQSAIYDKYVSEIRSKSVSAVPLVSINGSPTNN